MEANEMHEFAEAMEKAGENSLKHVSVTISILAVLVAGVTVLGHRAHTEAVLEQARASDTWNEFQARRIRSQQVETASDLLRLQPGSDAGAVAAKLQDYAAKQKGWAAETAEDTKEAREHEAKVERAERQASRYDLGEALLQIAVVLASVTLLTRKSVYVAMALVLGGAGLLWAASALLIRAADIAGQ